ncbi:ATP-binding protein [Galbitalea sp. SE-J8]|uniref:ATP-binding protein n=1 Tax=Galbitalea sp. SE-J8 TaxID=3054952 RepID=UPI00259D29C1|nr:ATP-binding protein [Galbitalea sp. SE-J8]MDM4764366.1 ATP-binding protein [Galbitalea sp. SE-J8]
MSAREPSRPARRSGLSARARARDPYRPAGRSTLSGPAGPLGRQRRSTLSAPAPRGLITLIDGRSGAGKTLFAERLARATPGAQLVHLDELYPGWNGLAAGSASVAAMLTTGRYRRWDWAESCWREVVVLDPIRALIVEGVGALTRASAALADRRIWLDADAALRRERALARDGDSFAPHWDEWAAQEDALLARERPRALSDRVIHT